MDSGLHPLHGVHCGGGVAKGGEADVALTAGAEAGAGGGGHIGLIQQQIKEVPGPHTAGGLEPDIGSVDPAEHLEPGRGEALPDDLGVFAVVVDLSLIHI